MENQNLESVSRPLNTAFAGAILGLLALGFASSLKAQVTNGVFAPSASPEGHNLTDWEAIWGRWEYGQTVIPADANGNAVVSNVVMIPYPTQSTTGQVVSTNVTLLPNQPFMLPLWGLYGNTYVDGTPPDVYVSQSIFSTLSFTFKIDGDTVLGTNNAMQYYTEVPLNPVIPFNYYPYNAIIWFQIIGAVGAPLATGNHVLTLDAENTQPLPPNFGPPYFAVHSQWDLTVLGAPVLRLAPQGGGLSFSWPQLYAGYTLEGSDTINPSHWSAVTNSVQSSGTNLQVMVSHTTTNRFFRLRGN